MLPGDARLPSDQSVSFKGGHHWWTEGGADAEVSPQVDFGGRPAEHARISIDEGQILTLLGRKGWTSV